MGDARGRVLVLGAGVMGHGIAQVAAMAGHPTVLTDPDEAALARAMARVRANLDKGVDRGKVTSALRDDTLGRLEARSDATAAAGGAAYVIEAVPEVMALKQQIFRELDDVVPRDCVFGTNTSSLPITEIASETRHPDRVIGTHFFNPPHIVTLLEVVRAVQTSDETVARVTRLGERMGRELVFVNDSPGFATSRLGLVLGLEAIRMLEAGVASAEDIDRAMELGYRHPMGPLKLTDLVGLDTRLKIAEHLHRELGGDRFHPPPLLRRLVRAGKLGKKSGEGFYRW